MAEDHYSLSAKVFHSIREDILNGKYQANEELKEKNIGDDLGVSRVGSGADHAGTVGGTGRNRIFIRFSLFQRKLGSDTGTG